ncbi:MAG: ABC transporter ATP-binding protein [Bdellovibrio sp.]|nr:MAG: ABC transporter ATP-binding protein [Bdellovibrio sp.]
MTVRFNQVGAKGTSTDQEILKDLSLTIVKGERVAIVGPSGLGKSTLLKTLAGLIRPTVGTLWVEGQNFYNLSSSQQQRLLVKMGMLFQRNALFDSMKNGENVRFPLKETTHKSAIEIEAIVDQFLAAVGLLHAKDLYPDEISGGMQKRLGIARAMALEPEILFYDDPTAGLDPITSRKIIELMINLQKQKQSTLVVVTNDMNRAFQVADRIFFVFKKDILSTGSPEETRKCADPRVQQFIHGRPEGPLTEVSA